MARCFLALGSNLGNRREHLSSGVMLLRDAGVELVRSASTYSTEPVGLRDQPRFLNTAIEVHYDRSAGELLSACQDVERRRHRRRFEPNGPRTIDVDIVFFGDHIIRTTNLVVPHPRYFRRRFVLEPLAEIAADFVDPLLGKSMRTLLSDVDDPAEVIPEGPPLF